jgi:Rieske Fe-S protein
MRIDRRQFIVVAAATAWGCQRKDSSATQPATSPAATAPSSAPSEKVVDAGALAQFSTDQVYDGFRQQGFFVIRRDGKLFALSSICTHKGCKVRVADDQTFFCKCHGSTFDRDGKVTKKPATRDLPRLAVVTDERHHVLVNLNKR